jgi:esterase/lipase superfamily enzyme
MGAQQTNARNAGTSPGDEKLYGPFGSLLLLQLIYDLLPNSTVGDHGVNLLWSHCVETEDSPELFRLLVFVRTIRHDLVPYLQENSRYLPPSLQKYMSEPLRSWKRFLETNLRVNKIDLSRLVTFFVREHVKREVDRDLRYLAKTFRMERGVEYLAKADHDTGELYVKCAVAAAWSLGECKNDGLGRHLLPRFYLLQALCDKLPILTSTYETSEQCRMSREISGFFALILDAASAGNEMYVSEVVDRFLVPYLKSQSELAKALRDYLPKRYQSWKDFLDRMKFNDEEKVFFAINCDPSPEDSLQLLKACESLIADFMYKYLAEVVQKIRRPGPVAVFRVPEGHTEVDVFYATDRHVTVDGEYIGRHSATSAGREGKELHYGITTVGIPDKGGRSRRQESPLKHVEILSIDTTLQHENRGFVKKINDELLAQEASAREVLLYIHGYNVNHKDAIKQAAQLKHDLKFKGLVIVYSWPSNGTLWGYKHDEKLIEKSAPWLRQFITTLLTEVTEGKKVHILAHDMGNRALIEALHDSEGWDSLSPVEGGTSHSSNRQNIVELDVKGALENVIFLAPDAMRARFEDMDLNNMCNWRRTKELPPFLFTIYSSAVDRKLFLPWRLHKQNQLVDTQSLVQMENRGEYSRFASAIEVIDTSGVDINISCQHSYMSLDHKFLHDDIAGDIRNLLSSKQPAGERCKNFNGQGRSLSALEREEGSPIFYAFDKSRLEKETNWKLKDLK